MNRIALILFTLVLMSSCSDKPATLPELGSWKGELKPGEQTIPFILEIKRQDSAYLFSLINGEEVLSGGKIEREGDSIKLDLPVFDSWFMVRVNDEKNRMEGTWYNHSKGETITFSATHGVNERFESGNTPGFNITGKWETGFYDPADKDLKVTKALGIFEQSGNYVTGTFLTPTGDYRYLEGVVDGREVKLSAFDGAHAYLFTGRMERDRLEGDFWSGSTVHKKWVAERNEEFSLPGADTISYALPDKKPAFTFPDLNGNPVSLSDEKFRDKVVILQVMGSWCPNCMDETAYLSALYDEKKDEGLEIIALAFERAPEEENARKAVQKLKDHYNAGYTFLIAGRADKDEASLKLPFVSGIEAFPTTIFLNRKGEVASILSGYNGPATGYYHKNFIGQTEEILGSLL